MVRFRTVTLLSLLAAVLCIVAVSACTGADTGADTEKPMATVKEGVKMHPTDSIDTISESGDWLYRKVKNNLTDVPTYYAENISHTAQHIQDEEQLDMELKIILCRRKGVPDEVVLADNRGVFNMGSKNKTVQVRFDNGPVQKFNCSLSEEYLSGGLKIDDAARFISMLSKSDSCRIGTSYLYNGELIFTHNLKGLKW